MANERNGMMYGAKKEESYEESKPVYGERDNCAAVGNQEVNVCVPVTIKPFGEVGNTKTKCVGKAVVTAGYDKCAGKPGGVCKFTISQKLRVEVPVVFGARAEVGEASIDCECAETTDGGKYRE